jgi:hypothetical protein
VSRKHSFASLFPTRIQSRALMAYCRRWKRRKRHCRISTGSTTKR